MWSSYLITALELIRIDAVNVAGLGSRIDVSADLVHVDGTVVCDVIGTLEKGNWIIIRIIHRFFGFTVKI